MDIHMVDRAIKIPPTFELKLSGLILRWRWLLMIAISVLVAFLEYNEHQQEIVSTGWLDPYFVRELVQFGVILPLLGGLLLTVVSRARGEQVYTDQQREISRQLASAEDWDQLTSMLVELPQSILPIANSSLYLYNPVIGRFEPAAEWHSGVDKGNYPDPLLQQGHATLPETDGEKASDVLPRPYHCQVCALAQDSSVRSLVPCSNFAGNDPADNLNSYCLPLVHCNQPIALLHFSLASKLPITADQKRFLNNVSPAMALAVEAASPQRSASILADATKAERQRIAQDLHDSLAQNIAYLRLKLDQLSGEDALQEIAAVHRQLEQMRDVANQAYQQVRGTLVNLRPEVASGMQASMANLVKTVSARVIFKINLFSEGVPFDLTQEQEQQALSVVQEALTNVEKHARATLVNIWLHWTKETLLITLADDGCGFDPATVKSDGHYGLAIMKERAATVGADLVIASYAGQGTRLSLTLPNTKAEAQLAQQSASTANR
jgi:signal transduction histidine kinase